MTPTTGSSGRLDGPGSCSGHQQHERRALLLVVVVAVMRSTLRAPARLDHASRRASAPGGEGDHLDGDAAGVEGRAGLDRPADVAEGDRAER